MDSNGAGCFYSGIALFFLGLFVVFVLGAI